MTLQIQDCMSQCLLLTVNCQLQCVHFAQKPIRLGTRSIPTCCTRETTKHEEKQEAGEDHLLDERELLENGRRFIRKEVQDFVLLWVPLVAARETVASLADPGRFPRRAARHLGCGELDRNRNSLQNVKSCEQCKDLHILEISKPTEKKEHLLAKIGVDVAAKICAECSDPLCILF